METSSFNQFPTQLLRDAPLAVSVQTPMVPETIPGAQAFQFRGDGRSYFGVWIINMVLTLITFGLYSPWAKVRREQFFHANTWMGGANFNYLGQPAAILRGRVVALVLVGAYQLSKELSGNILYIVIAVLAIVLPWLLKRSLVFRARNTMHRGLTFRFTGGNFQAYFTFLFWGILAFTFVTAPIALQRIRSYAFNHAHYGDLSFRFTPTAGQYYKVVFRAAPYWLLASILGGVLSGLIGPGGLVIAAILAYWLTRAHYTAHMHNLVWNNTTLGPHRFESNARVSPLFWLMLKNTVLTVLTVGLYRPYAVVSVAKYRLSTLRFIPGAPLDGILGVQSKNAAAAGSETADFFNLDIAL